MNYDPAFTGPIEGYVSNFLRTNYWRVKHTLEYDDCKQEAALVFLQVKVAYPQIDTPQHFMALFKTSWYRHFTDLSNRDSQSRTIVYESCCCNSDDEVVQLDVVGDLDNAGMLTLMIEQAPADIKQILTLFLNAPTELLEAATTCWRGNGKYRPEGNAMINRMLGLPEKTDALAKVHKYFENRPV